METPFRRVHLLFCLLFPLSPAWGQVPEPRGDLSFSIEATNASVARLVAYSMAVEHGTGTPLNGADLWARFDDAKRLVLEGGLGYVSGLDVRAVPGRRAFEATAAWQPKGDVKRDGRAFRLLLDTMSNPQVMVLMLEANLGREVLRSSADAKVKQALIRAGYRVQAAPLDYAKKLEEARRGFEFRRKSSGDVSVNPAFGSAVSFHIDEEYMINWRQLVLGQGNDEDTFSAASSVGASYVVIGDCYTLEVPVPPAAGAWAAQGYKQARAYLNLQAVGTKTRVLAVARTDEGTGMDFTAETAGNKAISAAAARGVDQLAYEMAANLQSRDLGLK